MGGIPPCAPLTYALLVAALTTCQAVCIAFLECLHKLSSVEIPIYSPAIDKHVYVRTATSLCIPCSVCMHAYIIIIMKLKPYAPHRGVCTALQ